MYNIMYIKLLQMCNPDIELHTVCMVHGRKPERIMSMHIRTPVLCQTSLNTFNIIEILIRHQYAPTYYDAAI